MKDSFRNGEFVKQGKSKGLFTWTLFYDLNKSEYLLNPLDVSIFSPL